MTYVTCLFRSFLIEEKCRFLSNFSSSTAEVELPGEFLLPKVGVFKHLTYQDCGLAFSMSPWQQGGQGLSPGQASSITVNHISV